MKYKRAVGMRRLRPSDLADMGHVSRGLLPDDIEDMAETMEDLLDLAEELKETMGHLSSGQVSCNYTMLMGEAFSLCILNRLTKMSF